MTLLLTWNKQGGFPIKGGLIAILLAYHRLA